MKRLAIVALGSSILIFIAMVGAYWFFITQDDREPSRLAFTDKCSDCHGQGNNGPDLFTRLRLEETADSLAKKILTQHADLIVGAQFDEPMIKALALYILERRQELPSILESHNYRIPRGLVRTQLHDFTVQLVTKVGKGPYSIAPLPDGRILLVEKVRGLTLVDKLGNQGELIEGTPRVWQEIIEARGSLAVLGSMLDVELHPDYSRNGWIYLSHSDRCQLDCASPWPVTMVRVIRGRLDGNRWVDSEEIWSVNKSSYTVVPDAVASGRLTFDHDGHLYVTVGGKSSYDNLHDMDTPYGKIHRIRDDGSIPADNPFWQKTPIDITSSRNTVWSYGHRTAQGLATNPLDGTIWATEMGPRGGDEVNLIKRGGNYGWPLYTEGLNYNADYIKIGQELGLDFDISETITPIVDFTPAPSLSNFTFHYGNQFPAWRNDLLIGSLRAQTLFRIRIENNKAVDKERLLTRLGRIRDVEMGTDGFVYLLIEHDETGSLLRIRPHL